MTGARLNRLSGRVLLVLSLIALALVAIGYTQPPLPDEGMLAHLFQLSVAAMLPTLILFALTADWSQPATSVRRLALPGIALTLAFAALYYLEHHWYR